MLFLQLYLIMPYCQTSIPSHIRIVLSSSLLLKPLVYTHTKYYQLLEHYIQITSIVVSYNSFQSASFSTSPCRSAWCATITPTFSSHHQWQSHKLRLNCITRMILLLIKRRHLLASHLHRSWILLRSLLLFRLFPVLVPPFHS